MTGVVDWVSDGTHVVRLKNGHPLLGEITGSGCMAGSSVATFCGALSMASKAESEKPSNPLVDGDMFVATIAGCVEWVFSPRYSDLPPRCHEDFGSRHCIRNCSATPRRTRARDLPPCLHRRTIKTHAGGAKRKSKYRNRIIIYRHCTSPTGRYCTYMLSVPICPYSHARTREKGIALVGCNQFFSSYVACGGDSIMWKVYANRVFRLRFFSLLCRTDPWIKTRSPEKSSKGWIS